MRRLWKPAIVAVAVLALAVVAIGIVGAQTDGDPTRPFSNFLSRLADNLGISETKLQEAIDQTSVDIVDEKEAAGDLTEEQAARIRERIASGEGLPFFGRFRFDFSKGFGHGFGHLGVASDAVADFLGISVDDLRTARADAQSLAQIAEANGVSRADLIAFLVGQTEQKLAAKVEEGKLDQARADEILGRFQEGVDDLVDRTEPFPHGRRHHGLPLHEEMTPEAETTTA